MNSKKQSQNCFANEQCSSERSHLISGRSRVSTAVFLPCFSLCVSIDLCSICRTRVPQLCAVSGRLHALLAAWVFQSTPRGDGQSRHSKHTWERVHNQTENELHAQTTLVTGNFNVKLKKGSLQLLIRRKRTILPIHQMFGISFFTWRSFSRVVQCYLFFIRTSHKAILPLQRESVKGLSLVLMGEGETDLHILRCQETEWGNSVNLRHFKA